MNNKKESHFYILETNVFNCVNFLIRLSEEQQIDLNNNKLQKILYYAQAYHLVKNKKQPLFIESIEAWERGPVVPDVYFEFSSFYKEKLKPLIHKAFNSSLSLPQQNSLTYIIRKYGYLNAEELNKQTCYEDPWQDSFQNFDLLLNIISHQQLFIFFKNKFYD
ncbi:Panacea domain-containing protein ['Camptotheca acuminata' phytoplasma]|uniref:Panacea domain-containing protein n=1 Tax='Camptotheca acuminata' phytoplasma TaxID=3239192 RepID=UPI003519F45E